jgi:hypothetical protein
MTNKLVKKLNKRFSQKQDELRKQPGIMGDGNGNLLVTGVDSFVYVTIGDKAVPVFNNRVTPQIGVKIWVGYAPEEPNLFQVLSTRSDTPTGLNQNFTGYAPARRYEWGAVNGGQDPLHVHLRAFSPLKIGMSTAGGMNVSLYRGRIWTGTAYKDIATQDIDLTSYIPGTTGKAAFVLITIDNTGTVIKTDGADVDIASLAITDIPTVPNNTAFISGAVRVYNGQTLVQEGRTNTDFVDLRFSGYVNNSAITPELSYLITEDLTTQITGSTAHFDLTYEALTKCLVYCNLRQQPADVTMDSNMLGFTLSFTPTTADKLIVDYYLSNPASLFLFDDSGSLVIDDSGDFVFGG